MIDQAAARRATQEVPSIPRDADGPVFREPWEAQAFAMTLALHERGLFTWPEWAAALADEIKRAQAAGDPDTGETYYPHWLGGAGEDGRREGRRHAATRCIAIATPGTTPATAPRTAADRARVFKLSRRYSAARAQRRAPPIARYNR